MKNYILSPICSALIIPGLGQVMNKRILKGLIMMGLVFVIFLAITFKLARLIIEEINSGDISDLNRLIEDRSLSGDLSVLWVLVIIFIILWLYSIVDAFLDGLKIEKRSKKNPDEMPST